MPKNKDDTYLKFVVMLDTDRLDFKGRLAEYSLTAIIYVTHL